MMLRMLACSGTVLLGFVLGVVQFAPLEKALALMPLAEQGVTIYGAEGRVLSGHVKRVQFADQTVNDVHWWLNPLWILSAQAGGDIVLNYGPNIQLRGQFRVRPDGTLKVADLSANGQIRDFKPMLRLPFLPVDGQLRLEIADARLVSGRPQSLQGALYINALNWSLQKPPLVLGNYVVDISTNDEGIILGALRDDNATVGATGSISLSPDGQYKLDAGVNPTAKAPPLIRNSLSALGQPDGKGAYPLKYQGQIPGW